MSNNNGVINIDSFRKKKNESGKRLSRVGDTSSADGNNVLKASFLNKSQPTNNNIISINGRDDGEAKSKAYSDHDKNPNEYLMPRAATVLSQDMESAYVREADLYEIFYSSHSEPIVLETEDGEDKVNAACVSIHIPLELTADEALALAGRRPGAAPGDKSLSKHKLLFKISKIVEDFGRVQVGDDCLLEPGYTICVSLIPTENTDTILVGLSIVRVVDAPVNNDEEIEEMAYDDLRTIINAWRAVCNKTRFRVVED